MAPIDWMFPVHMPHLQHGQEQAQRQAYNGTMATNFHDPRGTFLPPTTTRGKSMFGAIVNAFARSITRSWEPELPDQQYHQHHSHQGASHLVARESTATPTPAGTSPFAISKTGDKVTMPMVILLCVLCLGVLFYILFLDVYRKTPFLLRISAKIRSGIDRLFWKIEDLFHRHKQNKQGSATASATCTPSSSPSPRTTANHAERGQAAATVALNASNGSSTVMPSVNGNGNANGNAHEKGKENATPPFVPMSESAIPTIVFSDDDGQSGLPLAPPPIAHLPPLPPSYHSTPAAGHNSKNGGEGPSSLRH